MHATCRSCHVPPPQPEPVGALTDCAVCHGPEEPAGALYLLLSTGTATIEVRADGSLAEGEREAFEKALLLELAGASVRVRPAGTPGAAPVRVAVSVTEAAASTDDGVDFFVARARAVVTLHRVRPDVEGAPGVAADRDSARRAALDRLAEAVGRLF